MSKTKTQKQFLEEMMILHPNIEVKGLYKNNATKIECVCKKCGNKFWQTPNSLLSKHGCPFCNNRKSTHSKFVDKLKVINPNIEIIGMYVTARTKIECQCKIDNYVWYATPDSLLRGHGCAMCRNRNNSNSQLKTTEKFISEFNKIHPTIEVISKYKGSHKQITLKCKECGDVWATTPTNALRQNNGCPNCNKSYGEKCVKNYLVEKKINFDTQKKFDDLLGLGGRKLSYDFYLPDYRILIEINGVQHKRPIKYFGGQKNFIIQQEHDKRKREYAQNNNYKLLEIWYYDFENMYNIIFDAVFGGENNDTDK